MKSLRQAKLLELIRNNNYDRQEELQAKLNELGFKVTQATVSRDIRELGIIKSEGDDGVYKYREIKARELSESHGKYSMILKQAVSSVTSSYNLVVVKTFSGMGSAAGAAFDALQLTGVLGSLAGDDTLLVIANDTNTAEKVAKELKELIGN